MGLSIDRATFTEDERDAFRQRLLDSLEALALLLDRPGFGEGPDSLGAEVELALVDRDGRPLRANTEVLERAADDRLVTELNRFNLEANLSPVPLRGRPFDAIGRELRSLLDRLDEAAAPLGGQPMPIGILPTLTTHDVQEDALSPDIRYTALDGQLRRLRHQPFQLDIAGEDHLRVACEHVTMEGANTSLQLHLRVDPTTYGATWNAAQLASCLMLTVAANSPSFLQHRLWDETRIALFKQSVDPRGTVRRGRRARVGFGVQWQDGTPLDEFRQGVEEFAPLLPVVSDEDPVAVVRSGGVPQLLELRLHQGTVWRWNRAVYDAAGGGHVRLEFRCLPSGPSVPDMLANLAVATGLILALRRRIDELKTALSFADVHAAFYRAAREGPDAVIPWLVDGAVQQRRGVDVLVDLLPAARRELLSLGVVAEDVDPAFTIVAERAASGRTGARWQRRALAAASHRDDPWAAMFARYCELARSGVPVHEWPD